MNRHPSRSVLRQILDEPGAVPEPDRIHAASCATCLRHSEAMAADAGVSLGVVVATLMIMATGWLWVDPAVSLCIAAVVLASGDRKSVV